MNLHIGIDFDNTIVSYDLLFYKIAIEKKIIPPTIQKRKNSVRDYLRNIGKNDIWTELQGIAYGLRIEEAAIFPGVIDFFTYAKRNNIKISIVSHKTKYPVIGPSINLHNAAERLLIKNGFFNDSEYLIKRECVYFLETKEQKIKKIKNINCDIFIDDLPEIFFDKIFPDNVMKILFDPFIKEKNSSLLKMDNWNNLVDIIKSEYKN